MSILSELLSSAIVQRLGWTLLHSVWQFALIAILLSALLAALRKRSANTRYLAACVGLVAMLTTDIGGIYGTLLFISATYMAIFLTLGSFIENSGEV